MIMLNYAYYQDIPILSSPISILLSVARSITCLYLLLSELSKHINRLCQQVVSHFACYVNHSRSRERRTRGYIGDGVLGIEREGGGPTLH